MTLAYEDRWSATGNGLLGVALAWGQATCAGQTNPKRWSHCVGVPEEVGHVLHLVAALGEA